MRRIRKVAVPLIALWASVALGQFELVSDAVLNPQFYFTDHPRNRVQLLSMHNVGISIAHSTWVQTVSMYSSNGNQIWRWGDGTSPENRYYHALGLFRSEGGIKAAYHCDFIDGPSYAFTDEFDQSGAQIGNTEWISVWPDSSVQSAVFDGTSTYFLCSDSIGRPFIAAAGASGAVWSRRLVGEGWSDFPLAMTAIDHQGLAYVALGTNNDSTTIVLRRISPTGDLISTEIIPNEIGTPISAVSTSEHEIWVGGVPDTTEPTELITLYSTSQSEIETIQLDFQTVASYVGVQKSLHTESGAYGIVIAGVAVYQPGDTCLFVIEFSYEYGARIDTVGGYTRLRDIAADEESLWMVAQASDNIELHLLNVSGLSTSAYDRPRFQYEDGISLVPNPFNSEAKFKFDLAEAGEVRAIVYDVLGRETARIADGVFQAGEHAISVNAQAWASGVYFLRLETPEMRKTMKMLLVR